MPNAVALDEPMGRKYLTGKADAARAAEPGLSARVRSRFGGRHASPAPVRLEEVADRVQRFAAETRMSALTRGVVRTKSVDGAVSGSKVSDEKDEKGLRVRLSQVGEIPVGKPLTDDFTLAIKQCGSFTAALEVLTDRFPVFALVRNPLSLLVSWQAVPMPIRDGRIPVGESLSPELAAALDGIDDRVDRQFYLLAWFFGAFDRLLPPASVIRYEDIVASGGTALAVAVPEAGSLDAQLSDRNSKRPHGEDHDLLQQLAARLLLTDGPWWKFYDRESVTDLLSAIS
jgi:hypothetical protein